MKTTQKQFELFTKDCAVWAERFGLQGWDIDYYLKDTEDAQARTYRSYIPCTVIIQFNTTITKNTNETWEELIDDTAKHEMLHILVGNLALLAQSRYVTEDEVTKAEEELIVRLGKIII